MRYGEWGIVLSFIPILGLPWVALAWRRRWLLVAAPLPVAVSILHVVIEGWRIQMVPLYGLALLIALIRLPEILRGPKPLRRAWGILGAIGTAGLVVTGGLLAGWLLPVITLPEPTGPYPVGIVDREIVDVARGRRLMVSVWYPAAQRGEPAPLTHYPDALMQGLGDAFGVPALAFQHFRYVNTNASEHAPLLDSSQPLPVVVFSHGMVGLRFQSSPLLQELASWGYVVVAVDHTDAAAVTIFPDGESRPYDL